MNFLFITIYKSISTNHDHNTKVLTISSAGFGTIVTIIFDKALSSIESETTLHNRTVSSSPPITVDKYSDGDDVD